MVYGVFGYLWVFHVTTEGNLYALKVIIERTFDVRISNIKPSLNTANFLRVYGRLLFLQMGPINKTLYDHYPKVLIWSIIILQKFATVFISTLRKIVKQLNV